MNVNKVLEERGSKYGSFDRFSCISRDLKNTVYLEITLDTGKGKTNAIIKEGLDMIIHKLARVANGDPYYLDSWRDLSAYAKLVCDELEKTDGTTDIKTKQVVKMDGKWVDISSNI